MSSFNGENLHIFFPSLCLGLQIVGSIQSGPVGGGGKLDSIVTIIKASGNGLGFIMA